MNRWRIAGLIIVTLLAAWLVLRSCLPEEPAPAPSTPPAREAFHASRPLRLEVATSAQPETNVNLAWLELELRELLSRGKMRVAPVGIPDQEPAFTLKVSSDGARNATLELIAPDGVVENRLTVEAEAADRLSLLSAIAARLPGFLHVTYGPQTWVALIGTSNAATYDAFLDASLAVLGPAGTGFTLPRSAPRAHNVEKLEALLRSNPKFARARATLAAEYLSVGGQDEQSLTQLAETSAERALAADPDLATAVAIQGIVHARRNEWVAARESFERALELDRNSIVALEGLACLLTDVGDADAARPYAERAIAVQPNNVGAHECLAYASEEATKVEQQSFVPASARVAALRALLSKDVATARQLLRQWLPAQEYAQWAEPLLRAAENRKRIPEALQAVTLAASESSIDASTEIVAGAALREADFVLNRMARLQRQNERVPLRVLWLSQAPFLRKHARFHKVVDTAGLPAYWQEHGVPDVCTAEPRVYGCKTRAARATESSR